MELYPGFSLYRGLYEMAQSSFSGDYMGTDGMRWKDVSHSSNGMWEVLVIMSVEWLVVLLVAFYVDQVKQSGKSPLFFLQNFRKKPLSSFRKPSMRRQDSKVSVPMEKHDILQEVMVSILLLPCNHFQSLIIPPFINLLLQKLLFSE